MYSVLTVPLTTRYGTVHYERALEVVELEGWVEEEGMWILICGDRDRPARQQRHTAIPVQRILEIDYIVADV